jgi:hypothetical protein
MVGKGDNFRPVQDKEKFESEWDRIFGDKKKVKVRKKTPKHAVTQEHKDKTKYDRKVGWDANGSPVETEE